MEKIFWVVNGDLEKVNARLEKGGRVKQIHTIGEPIVAFGYAGGKNENDYSSYYTGDICAYIVVEFD
ncbi:MAG: hypothetical protein IKY90_08455 [Oscillospiraceae bacterium]|nr:hypothetical protein [Oscillospiraceae bacterium]